MRQHLPQCAGWPHLPGTGAAPRYAHLGSIYGGYGLEAMKLGCNNLNKRTATNDANHTRAVVISSKCAIFHSPSLYLDSSGRIFMDLGILL